MNDLVTRPGSAVMEMTEDELVSVLQNSIYPGAKLESIKMVIGYCRAAQLDPLQKPVHIVPMQVSTGKKDQKGWDIKEWRDVVMPGVGLYRTQAARTNRLAGIDEPEFGPMVTVGGIEVPEWCRVTVYRIVDGVRCAFTAVEYWEENYATKNKDTDAPNSMWAKRRRGQLAKCTQAQALRVAFPEIGAQPTAEEMEGKWIDGEFEPAAQTATTFRVGAKSAPAIESTGTTIDQPLQQPEPQEVGSAAKKDGPAKSTASSTGATASTAKDATSKTSASAGSGSSEFVGVGEQKYLQNKAAAVGADLDAVLKELGGLVLDKLAKADFEAVKRYLMDFGG